MENNLNPINLGRNEYKILKQLFTKGEQLTTAFNGISNQNHQLRTLRLKGLVKSRVSKLPSRTYLHSINEKAIKKVDEALKYYEAKKIKKAV